MKSSLTRLHTEPHTIERTWDTDGIPVLTAAVSIPCPVPADDPVSRRIRRFYRLQGRSYLRYCQQWLLPQAKAAYQAALAASAPLPQFHAELTYEVTYHDGGFWSLYTQSREILPSGQPFLLRRGDTWDLSAGYPVPIQSFFPRQCRWRRKLLMLAAQEVEQRERSGMAFFHPSWRRELRHGFNPRNFYLTEEGLVLFFPMHTLSPAAEIPALTIPYRTLRAFPDDKR